MTKQAIPASAYFCIADQGTAVVALGVPPPDRHAVRVNAAHGRMPELLYAIPASHGIFTPRHVSITLYNCRGQQVRTLFDGALFPGEHRLALTAPHTPLTAGRYFCRLRTDECDETLSFPITR
jgi:hypothetical protein